MNKGVIVMVNVYLHRQSRWRARDWFVVWGVRYLHGIFDHNVQLQPTQRACTLTVSNEAPKMGEAS